MAAAPKLSASAGFVEPLRPQKNSTGFPAPARMRASNSPGRIRGCVQVRRCNHPCFWQSPEIDQPARRTLFGDNWFCA